MKIFLAAAAIVTLVDVAQEVRRFLGVGGPTIVINR
jgi:hypothetical protein